MQVPGEAASLKIFIGEEARFGHHPLYEAIVMKARERGLAGATALRGPLGYGHSAKMHSAKILQLSDDLPVLIEIVDSQDKIDAFLPELYTLMGAESGLVTVEKVQVLQYGPKTEN
jgi:PII-like signaling protein